MGPIGVQEMIMIFVLALLLFGPKKLPELGRMLGRGVKEFQKAKSELKATFESHLSELERETREATNPTTTPAPDYSSSSYQYPYDDYGNYDPGQSSTAAPYEPPVYSDSATSESSNASATAVQDAEAHHDYSSVPSPVVSGTIPRSNGVQPVEHAAVHTEEGHSA